LGFNTKFRKMSQYLSMWQPLYFRVNQDRGVFGPQVLVQNRAKNCVRTVLITSPKDICSGGQMLYLDLSRTLSQWSLCCPYRKVCHHCGRQYSASFSLHLVKVLDSNTEYLCTGCSVPVTVCALMQGSLITNVARFFNLTAVVAKNNCFTHAHFIVTWHHQWDSVTDSMRWQGNFRDICRRLWTLSLHRQALIFPYGMCLLW
jgi:hypothetical protein